MCWRMEFQEIQQIFRYLSSQKVTAKWISKQNEHIKEKLVKYRMCRILYPELRIYLRKSIQQFTVRYQHFCRLTLGMLLYFQMLISLWKNWRHGLWKFRYANVSILVMPSSDSQHWYLIFKTSCSTRNWYGLLHYGFVFYFSIFPCGEFNSPHGLL